MIPNMYKIAGELTPFTMHVAARTLATHALSIFGDHSDVMACRQTGFALLCSNSVQEAHDMAAVAHAASLESRIPFLHYFDGFRTSHEVAKIEQLTDDDLRAMIAEPLIYAHRQRGLTPDRPVLRGTAQNPDVFFQAREAANGFYDACPKIVERKMQQLGELTGRRYGLFEYVGHPAAERVIVLMGSGAETAHEAVDHLVASGEKVGVLKVRLYRPFVSAAFLATLPKSVRHLAVLDRTKEPGAPGDPLYLDVTTALAEAQAEDRLPFAMPRVVAGRYGLSSKEFTPAMVKSVFDEIAKPKPKRHFTIGIVDDVTHTSIPWDASFKTEGADVTASLFYGLGADGTVGANKNSIKIIGQETELFAQGYFVYDSKKSGAITISHLRSSKRPIRSAYLVDRAGFVACHQFEFVDKIDVLEQAAPGAAFLLNAPFPTDQVWDRLPREMQEQLIEKKIKFYAIDAYDLAKRAGMGSRINTIMQTCFFAISGLLPRDEAIKHIKKAIEKTYGKRGPEIVRRNCEVVDQSLAQMHEIPVPAAVTAKYSRPPLVSERAPDFVQKITAVMLAGKGDLLPVSAFPVDGTWPVASAKWEKRNLALEIPVWDSKICIQCNQCALVCPHAAIRAKVYDESALAGAPQTFKWTPYRGNEHKGKQFTIQVAPEDCTGCNLCVNVCPAKDRTNPKHKAIDMHPQAPLREPERANYDFFLNLPELDRTTHDQVRSQELAVPRAAVRVLGRVQRLRRDAVPEDADAALRRSAAHRQRHRLLVDLRRQPADDAVHDQQRRPRTGLVELAVRGQRGVRVRLPHGARRAHRGRSRPRPAHRGAARRRLAHGDSRRRPVERGRDRRPARTGRRTARQARGTEHRRGTPPRNARRLPGEEERLARGRRRLGLRHRLRRPGSRAGEPAQRQHPGHGHRGVLEHRRPGLEGDAARRVGQVRRGGQTGRQEGPRPAGEHVRPRLRAHVSPSAPRWCRRPRRFVEAESYDGPSLIIAYSHCIAHGYDMANGVTQQKLAVDSGVWPLYRFDPRRIPKGEPPLHLDYGPPKAKVADYLRNESRFRVVERADPARYKAFVAESQAAAERRFSVYSQLSGVKVPAFEAATPGGNEHAEPKKEE